MSVDYRAIYGYGYHITTNMCAEMNEEKFEEFIDHDMTHIINGWGGDPSYFFGIVIGDADEYEPIQIIPFKEYQHEDFIKMLEGKRYFFPEKHWGPKRYIIQQIS